MPLKSKWSHRPGFVSMEFADVADEPENSIELVVEFESEGYYDPGQREGPVENCYPPEGDDERTITAAYLELWLGETLKFKVPVPKDKWDDLAGYLQEEINEADIEEGPTEESYL